MKTKDKMLGAGIGLAALAAAGSYFLSGKRGAKNRAALEDWALRMKGEVLEKMKDLKVVDEEIYNELVEETAERYGRREKISAAELKESTILALFEKTDAMRRPERFQQLLNAWTHIGRYLKGERL